MKPNKLNLNLNYFFADCIIWGLNGVATINLSEQCESFIQDFT